MSVTECYRVGDIITITNAEFAWRDKRWRVEEVQRNGDVRLSLADEPAESVNNVVGEFWLRQER